MNKKEVCPECKRTLRTKCFIFNRVKKIRICNRCDKKIGSNIFYVPFKERRDFIGKYSITQEEKNRLFKKFLREGNGEKEAWKKVNYLVYGLRKQRKIKATQRKGEYLGKMAKEKQKQEMKEKFVKGLK